MSCLLISGTPDVLNEVAKGPIKTWWGDQMKRDDPAKGYQELDERLEKAGVKLWVRAAFEVGAPLLAERLAIAEYKAKHPDFEMIAPEILSYQEALSIAMKDIQPVPLNEEQRTQVLSLLKNDESMKEIH